MPRWTVDVGLTIHYYEAILVWHFYHVIFDPDVYPVNWAAFNGKVSAHWQEEEHPLEGVTCEGEPALLSREMKPLVEIKAVPQGNGDGNGSPEKPGAPR